MCDTFPEYRGKLEYLCLGCGGHFGIEELLYTCPTCGQVLLIRDYNFDELKKTSGDEWRKIFDKRACTKTTALKGIFRFYELMAPALDEEDIIYLGEGNTSIIEASPSLKKITGMNFAVKNEGQNPSASFKDRGMACAFSFLRHLINTQGWDQLLTICASTGDTSAAAALYAAYAGEPIKSVVLLPQGKVTPQQLSQPLGSGATVIELPGVFDDCMKVVESLAENYRVSLLNSKNSWRILGQESFGYEVAQWRNWDMSNLCIFVPIGNAGNITAIMSSFLKLHDLGIITCLPRIFGVQSEHADPVYLYYAAESEREFTPVKVRPSTAQAAMIGNPVSFPRVKVMAERYRAVGGISAFCVVQVKEQDIMDSMLEANKHGHILCTQGGETYAGLKKAIKQGIVSSDEFAVLDSTAHILKFADFQQAYFEDRLDKAFEVIPDRSLCNSPIKMFTQGEKDDLDDKSYVEKATAAIAKRMSLTKRD